MGYFRAQVRRSGARRLVRRKLHETRLVGVGAGPSSPPWRPPLYLRFSAGPIDPGSNHQQGVFHASRLLHEPDRLTEAGRDALATSLTWFNKNLIAPNLNEPRAIFWFRSDAAKCLSKIWECIRLLREGEISVRMLRCTDPGLIVYRDDLQIAAVPQRRVKWRERTF